MMMGSRQIKFGEPRRDCLQLILAISKCQFQLLRVDIRQRNNRTYSTWTCGWTCGYNYCNHRSSHTIPGYKKTMVLHS